MNKIAHPQALKRTISVMSLFRPHLSENDITEIIAEYLQTGRMPSSEENQDVVVVYKRSIETSNQVVR